MQEGQRARNGVLYDYVYLEQEKTILVWKDSKYTYSIDVTPKGQNVYLSCKCPGGKYHHHCHHEDTSKGMFDFHRVFKPQDFLSQVAEEYYKEYLTR